MGAAVTSFVMFVKSKFGHALVVGAAAGIAAAYQAYGAPEPAFVSFGLNLVAGGVLSHGIAGFLDTTKG